MNANQDNLSMLDRPAIRLLMDRRMGWLFTTDPATDEPHVAPVQFGCEGDGSFVTWLPADSAQVRAIRDGGASVLSVEAADRHVPAALRDPDGWLTSEAIDQVHADVEIELLDHPATVEAEVAKLFGPSAGLWVRYLIGRAVLVRMRVTDVQVELRPSAERQLAAVS